jgi:hypothetical protein
MTVAIFVNEHTQGQLTQIIRTSRPASRFTNRLHSRQQHSNQDSDNGHHDQQLDQSESPISHFSLSLGVTVLNQFPPAEPYQVLAHWRFFFQVIVNRQEFLAIYFLRFNMAFN